MNTSNHVPTVRLRTATGHIDMPQLGFGVYKIPADEAEQAVSHALRSGYRAIDTAKLYENEEGVGAAIANCDIPRDDVFVTTKVWRDGHGYDETLRAFDASSKRLGLDTVDLYLIHWPEPELDKYVDTFKALLALRADGRIRAAGVSNFEPQQLQRLIDETGEAPAINQIKLNPDIPQHATRAFNAAHDIHTEAWGPLGQGGDLLQQQAIAQIASAHQRTPAQVVLRWHVQLGNVVIPKSVTPSRIEENIDIFDFELSDSDMATINSITPQDT